MKLNEKCNGDCYICKVKSSVSSCKDGYMPITKEDLVEKINTEIDKIKEIADNNPDYDDDEILKDLKESQFKLKTYFKAFTQGML